MSLPPLLPGTRNVLVVSLGVFVLYVLLAGGVGVPLSSWLAISPTPSIGWSWQWATHWMVSESQGGALRKLIELAIVYVMGSQYEAMVGPRRLYGLVVVGIVGAALGTFATIWMTPLTAWGDAAMTSALLCALAVRSAGREVRVPFLGDTSPWLFVVVFAGVAVLDAIYAHFVPLVGSYVGACLLAYLYERYATFGLASSTRGSVPKAPSSPVRARARPRFEVIEGGRSDDDDKPKYLN
jgi:hypothetical protein